MPLRGYRDCKNLFKYTRPLLKGRLIKSYVNSILRKSLSLVGFPDWFSLGTRQCLTLVGLSEIPLQKPVVGGEIKQDFQDKRALRPFEPRAFRTCHAHPSTLLPPLAIAVFAAYKTWLCTCTFTVSGMSVPVHILEPIIVGNAELIRNQRYRTEP
jgi:hypothetical protein